MDRVTGDDAGLADAPSRTERHPRCQSRGGAIARQSARDIQLAIEDRVVVRLADVLAPNARQLRPALQRAGLADHYNSLMHECLGHATTEIIVHRIHVPRGARRHLLRAILPRAA